MGQWALIPPVEEAEASQWAVTRSSTSIGTTAPLSSAELPAPEPPPDVQNLRLAMVPPFGKAGHLIEPVREIEQLFSGFPDRCLPR
jgi:hypothetical protein